METWQIVVLAILCPSPLWLALLWVIYAALMAFKRVEEELEKEGREFHWFPKLIGHTTLIVGWLVDFRCNLIECFFIFRELPKEALVTDRLKKYVHGPDGWRKDRAWAFEDMFQLNRLDPSGNHLD